MNQREAAKYLGISERTLRRYTEDGIIVARPMKDRVGKRLQYDINDLSKLKMELEARRAPKASNGRILMLATGDIVSKERIRAYFDKVMEAEESGEKFPVDFDEVWSLAYSRKDPAKRALTGKFFEGEDYEIRTGRVFHTNVENLSASLFTGKQKRKPNDEGRPEERIFLSTKCFEFFIAREVEEVFEVYRQCRTEIARQVRDREEEMEAHREEEAFARAQPQQPQLPLDFPFDCLLLLNLAQCEALTRLNPITLQNAAESGELRAVFHAGAWRVQPSDLKSYVAGLFKPVRSIPPVSYRRDEKWITDFAALIRSLVESEGKRWNDSATQHWHGTATELLQRLDAYATPEQKESHHWPQTPTGIGHEINRVAPRLRTIGIETTRSKIGGGGDRITHFERKG